MSWKSLSEAHAMLQTVNNASHLSPAVRAALELTAEERIQRVRSPRWIGYPMAKRILDRLEDLLTYPQTHRMPGLLLVGETNNGKTMIINRFQAATSGRRQSGGRDYSSACFDCSGPAHAV